MGNIPPKVRNIQYSDSKICTSGLCPIKENIGFENNAVHASKSPPITAKYIPCHIAGPTLSGREAPIYWAMKVLT